MRRRIGSMLATYGTEGAVNGNRELRAGASMLMPPFRAAYDPSEGDSASIDPLGLAAAYETLANRLLPNVTVRMSRIRFLTAMAVGAQVCTRADMQPDVLAADNVTPAWLVFEWLLLTSFAQMDTNLVSGQRIAGIEKTRTALREEQPLSHDRYLSTARIFGIGGIFRRLAVGAGLIDARGNLRQAGYELVDAWSRDQGLAGFVAGSGPGARLCRELGDVVQKSMQAKKVVGLTSAHAAALAKYLFPGPESIGSHERAQLSAVLLEAGSNRTESEALIAAVRASGGRMGRDQEPAFMRGLIGSKAGDLAASVQATFAFERFARAATDAFDLVRFLGGRSCKAGKPLTADVFAKHADAQRLALQFKQGLAAAERDGVAGQAIREHLPAHGLGEVGDAQSLFEQIVRHHLGVQRRKLPSGKAPWVELSDKGVWVTGRRAVEDWNGRTANSLFVHEFRMPTLSNFMCDLRMIEA